MTSWLELVFHEIATVTRRKVCAQSLERILTTALSPRSRRPTRHMILRQEMLVQFCPASRTRTLVTCKSVSLRTMNMCKWVKLTKIFPVWLLGEGTERLRRCWATLVFLRKPNNSGVSWTAEIWSKERERPALFCISQIERPSDED